MIKVYFHDPYYDDVVTVVDDKGNRVIWYREAWDEYQRRVLKEGGESDE